MAAKHLSPRLFDKLLRGDIAPQEARELAWHLLETCPECAGVVEGSWQASPEAEEPLAASSARVSPADDEADGISFGRIRQRLQASLPTLFAQKRQAPDLLVELKEHPLERRRLMIRNHPRFRTVPLAELLLEHAWQEGFQDPVGANEWVGLVLELLDGVAPGLMGEEVLHDLRSRAWAYRGNFRRIMSDFRGAEEAFEICGDFLERGTGDLLERARWYSLRTSLLTGQYRLSEAKELIQKAVTIYLSTDERHLAGRAMISQAMILNEEDDQASAVRVLREALAMIDSEREPRLYLVAQQNLLAYLTELGRNHEAMALLPKVRRLSVESGTRFDLLRHRWHEGKILLGLGHEGRAEAAFLEVRKGFAEAEVGYDMAAVSLELAALYLRQGRSAEIKELAAEMVPIFESRDVHQEAVAALMLFKRAVEMETLTARMVEEVSNVIERSRTRPRPRAEAPS